MDPDIRRFVDLLQNATSELGRPYFALPIAGQGLPVYRERVYAYELYHQLRRCWPSRAEWDFVLNGEVDKRGHPLLRGGSVRNRIPDLLVHRPGDMGGNLLTLEIKSVDANVHDVSRDLCKLRAFCCQVGYRQGVMLFFGDRTTAERLRDRCQHAVNRAHGEADPAHVLIYWHPAPCAPAVQVSWTASTTVKRPDTRVGRPTQ